MKRGIVCLAILGLLLTGAPIVAQDEAEPITWIAYLKAEPGKSGDYVELEKKYNREILDRLLADGALISWGIAVPMNHLPGTGFTHLFWVTANDWSAIDKLMARFMEAREAHSKEENKLMQEAFEATLDESARFDNVVQHLVYQSAAPAGGAPPRYLKLGSYTSKPGKGRDGTELYKTYSMPVYQSLLDSGTISSYGLFVNELHGASESTHTYWYASPDLAALDGVSAAFAEARSSRSEEEREKIGQTWRDTFEFGSHADQVLRIVHLGGTQDN